MASARGGGGGGGGLTSDCESSVSGLVRYSEPATRRLYQALVQGLQIVNDELQEVEHNLASIIERSTISGKLLAPILGSLPQSLSRASAPDT